MTKLLIVESPAKAKKIQTYLGEKYIVLSSYGHITGLKTDISAIETDNNFKLNFDILKDKKKIIKQLKIAQKKCDEVIIATDEDREGEAIAWHLIQRLSLDVKTTKRIIFNEITKTKIKEALVNPGYLRMNFVNAQFGRMALDHLVGFRLSPLLWNNVTGAKSAGRVQTLVVKLIIDKETMINEYVQKTFYKIQGVFYKNSIDTVINGCIEVEVKDHIRLLHSSIGTNFCIKNKKVESKERRPPPPFTTSTLQQCICKSLGLTSKQVMNIAQKLYENGFITYHRTDSVNLSKEFLDNCNVYINDKYGIKYSKMKQFRTVDKNSQEAHEAIRPTKVELNTLKADSLDNKIYELIWKRAIASQMSNEEFNLITLEISNKNYSEIFVSRIEDILFQGFKILYIKESEHPLLKFYKSLEIDDELMYKELTAEQRFKKQPERYSESTLIKELEKKGIGRPSTYASIIEKVQERKYISKKNIKGIEKEVINYLIKQGCDDIIEEKTKVTLNESKNKMVSTNLGKLVNDYLSKSFTDIILNYDFTSNLEKDLDSVLDGKVNYIDLLKNFYKDFIIIYDKLIMEGKKSDSEFDKGRLVGNHPDTNEPVYVRIAKYGPVAQIGEGSKSVKPKYINLKDANLDTITMDEIIERSKFPKILGAYNEMPIKLVKGKFGPCILYDGEFFSLYDTEKENLDSIVEAKAIEIIERKRNKPKKKVLKVLMDGRAELIEGPYSNYVRYVEKDGTERNIKIPRAVNQNNIDDEFLKKLLDKNR
jgi:DNA topoisomerase-1